jgi:hypothetical protein
MIKRFNSAFTMFVFVRGHQVVEYYFAVRDARIAANDVLHPQSARVVPLPRIDPPPDPERAKR